MPSCTLSHRVRDSEVVSALQERSLQKLQELSLRPEGFGDVRRQAWTFLLGVQEPAHPESNSTSTCSGPDSLLESWAHSPASVPTSPEAIGHSLEDDSFNISDEHVYIPPHPDARQVQLDTNRSFILYPVEYQSIGHRKSLQEGLHDVILEVLQKRPKLRYFQGYHDIITVLFLTLPAEVVLPSAEKLSLHRIRDSMGSGLDPLVGQLRVLKRLLRLIDPPYADVLETNSPLPYYALSNLLTLFSHDVPTLSLIQHVFDWLLCRDPIAVIWLAAAVILHHKQDILNLEREGEEAMGMMHAVLSALPELSGGELPHQDTDPQDKSLVEIQGPRGNVEDSGEFMDRVYQVEPEEDSLDGPDPKEFVEGVIPIHARKTAGGKTSDASLDELDRETKERTPSPSFDSLIDSWTADEPRPHTPSAVSIVDPTTKSAIETANPAPVKLESAENDEVERKVTPETEIQSSLGSTSPSRPFSRSRYLPGSYKEKKNTAPLPLPALLRQASELLIAYPPSSPALNVAGTFGPHSALHPKSPSSNKLLFSLSDDDAEACVGSDNVVLPPTQEEQDRELGPPRKSKEFDRRSRPRNERRYPFRFSKGVVVHKRTIMATAVLLLGVVMAFYGFGPGGRGHIRNGHNFGGGRRVTAWIGCMLGLAQKLGVGI